jgi:threonine dehydrogenase-like Zn-dependent dehydrogenase
VHWVASKCRSPTVKDPSITAPTDIIVCVDTSTIYGSDLHVLKGDVPGTVPGTVLGHEAVGTVEEVGASVTTVTTGLVDTFSIPQLMRLIVDGRLDTSLFATDRFPLGETMAAYDTFADAASTDALKVVREGAESAGTVSTDQIAMALAG